MAAKNCVISYDFTVIDSNRWYKYLRKRSN